MPNYLVNVAAGPLLFSSQHFFQGLDRRVHSGRSDTLCDSCIIKRGECLGQSRKLGPPECVSLSTLTVAIDAGHSAARNMDACLEPYVDTV